LSFHMQRLTLFLYSSIGRRINFLTEIEFEDGAREINVESAYLDLALHPWCTLRGGIVLNPIGSFNQNHDGPLWEFVDRPVAATRLLPATWSNAGAGLYGKIATGPVRVAYEAYLTNGFDDRIVLNTANRTWLGAAKENAGRFEESANGIPLFTAKVACARQGLGELGLSYMGGVYNTFRKDGIALDKKRRVHAWAVDASVQPGRWGTHIQAEVAWVQVDLPEAHAPQYGKNQYGGFCDIVQSIWKRPVLGFDRSVVYLSLRTEYVDWHAGDLAESGYSAGDDYLALVPAISWRPHPQTVLRFNYRYAWEHDLQGNAAVRSASFLAGFSSYF